MSRAVVSAVRTPIGRYGGALAGVRPDDLAAVVIGEAAVARAGVDAAAIEDVSSAAPTRPARTTAMSRAWRRCSPASPIRLPGSRSTDSAPAGSQAVVGARTPWSPVTATSSSRAAWSR